MFPNEFAESREISRSSLAEVRQSRKAQRDAVRSAQRSAAASAREKRSMESQSGSGPEGARIPLPPGIPVPESSDRLEASTTAAATSTRGCHLLCITVLNKTGAALEPYPISTATASTDTNSFPPERIAAGSAGLGGTFTFAKSLCAISAFKCPIGDRIWILFVETSDSALHQPIIKTAFCPPRTEINSFLVNNIKNGNAYKDTAMYNVSIAGLQVTYQARCRVTRTHSAEFEFSLAPANPGRALEEEDSSGDTETPPVIGNDKGGFNRASTAQPPNHTHFKPLKVSIEVSNQTSGTITPCSPCSCVALPPSVSHGTIPEVVERYSSRSGGVLNFDPNLRAISAFVTPDPNHIWVLFVEACDKRGLVAKTVFYPAPKQIDEILVLDIKGSSVYKDTATRTFEAMGVGIRYKATCKVLQNIRRDMEPHEDLTVEFELTANHA